MRAGARSWRSILATARCSRWRSNPTYKPSVFVGRTTPRKLAPLLDPKAAEQRNFPGLNRAIDGLYPPGSTFKPVTALAALEEHVITPYESLPCTAEYEKDEQVFKNWDPYVIGR